MLLRMGAPFRVTARAERASVSPGSSTLWAALRLAGTGQALEAERAPLAVALVVDASTSMRGEPIAHVLKSCELLVKLLGPSDRLAIVTFSRHADVMCGLTAMDDAGRAQVVASLGGVRTSRGTNLHGGLAAAAGLLMTAPDKLRRIMVVMSDGEPNIGISSSAALGSYVRSLSPLGVSSLGFGLHHDEDVLHAIAVAGSGRYAYVPDPIVARVDLARAALAHGGIVADEIELRIRLSEGVELLRVLPASQLRHGGSGVVTAIGDVFVDEDRVLAIELAIDIAARATGELARLVVTGRAAGGAVYDVQLVLAVDVHAGPHAVDRDAQRDVMLVRADAARAEARAHVDRGALAWAGALLRDMIRAIEATEGFVRNDGSPLAELREQLVDEVAHCEQRGSKDERAHRRKGALGYYSGAVSRPTAQRAGELAPGVLIGMTGPCAGQRYPLMTETIIGRSSDNDIVIDDHSLSRHHARIMYLEHEFVLHDHGSNTGCAVNGARIVIAKLADGDLVQLGRIEFRFEHMN
jgi:Ca-activated chloride channel homolog